MNLPATTYVHSTTEIHSFLVCNNSFRSVIRCAVLGEGITVPCCSSLASSILTSVILLRISERAVLWNDKFKKCLRYSYIQLCSTIVRINSVFYNWFNGMFCDDSCRKGENDFSYFIETLYRDYQLTLYWVTINILNTYIQLDYANLYLLVDK